MTGFWAGLVLMVLAVPVLLVVALVGLGRLRDRVGRLEAELHALRTAQARAEAAARFDTVPARAAPAAAPDAGAVVPPTPGARDAGGMRDDDRRDTVESPPGDASSPPLAPQPSTPPPAPRVAEVVAAASSSAEPPYAATPPPRAARPGPLQLAVRAVRRWFTEGNVPVKVGMLVLFAGVASLLKYASDQGWVRLPIELRLAGVALAALGALTFAWRQREQRRSFALSLQGGAIGVMLMVVFAAARLYALMPAPAAFGLSVVLVAGTGVLAVLQDARALAVFGILAGFLCPLWLSTGQGSHVALFAYYALLNAGILAIAWARPWRVLNLMGFAFTFGIASAWGALSYRPEHFRSTEPFLLLFFAFYLLIPLLYARRRAPGRRDLVDSCLLFGTPLVAFSLQAALLRDQPLALAFCALALAALYALLATWTRTRAHFAPLLAPYAVLAVGLATLAVPLALSAHATASIFALEGAGALWLGLRQQRRLPQWAGVGLQLAAAFAFLGASAPPGHVAVANAQFMSMLLIAVGGLASARALQHARPGRAALAAYVWGLAWGLAAAVGEIERFVQAGARADALLLLAAGTAWLAAEGHRRWPARALEWTAVAGLGAGVLLALVKPQAPYAGFGALAWLAFAAVGVRTLRSLQVHASPRLGIAHGAWVASLLVALSVSLAWFTHSQGLGEGWRLALAGLPWLAALAATLWRPAWVGQPVPVWFERGRAAFSQALVLVLALGWVSALGSNGDAHGLPWVPLANPLDLAQAAALLLAAHWLHTPLAPQCVLARRTQWLAGAGFVLVSVFTLRAAHHLGGLAWDGRLLGSNLVQTSLTVVWSLLGVLGWIIGSRRQQRGLWLAGAVLMGVVLGKLLLVDRQHLGNLLGIVSFMAYGVLCTAVGYFAPAPPRHREAVA